MEPMTYRIPSEPEVIAAAVRVILREGTIASQRRLHELVTGALREKDESYAVSPERVRVLTLRSGLVGVRIRTRHEGTTSDVDGCPVCSSRVKRTLSRTLLGGSVHAGWRCSRCPWWTGREYRAPHHYTFFSRVEREPLTPQVRFRAQPLESAVDRLSATAESGNVKHPDLA